MSNLREVKNNILQEQMFFKDEEISTLSCPKNKKYFINKQLEILNNNFIDYISYWNEKYYRNGFFDGIKLLKDILNK